MLMFIVYTHPLHTLASLPLFTRRAFHLWIAKRACRLMDQLQTSAPHPFHPTPQAPQLSAAFLFTATHTDTYTANHTTAATAATAQSAAATPPAADEGARLCPWR